MSLATAQNTQAHTFSGPVVNEIMKSNAPANSLAYTANLIASYFMDPKNMASDVMVNPTVHTANLAAGAGIAGTGAGLQFALIAPEAAAAPKSAQPAPDATTGTAIGIVF